MAKILIIDNDYSMREVLKHFLKEAGYKIFTASNGDEGIQILKENIIDLIIADLNMTNKGGLESIADLHVSFPKIKIIVLAGESYIKSGVVKKLAKHLGVINIFSKPFPPTLLIETVKKTI